MKRERDEHVKYSEAEKTEEEWPGNADSYRKDHYTYRNTEDISSMSCLPYTADMQEASTTSSRGVGYEQENRDEGYYPPRAAPARH
jgi:hypothetical protein